MIARKTPTLQSDIPGFTNNEILGFLYDCVMVKKPVNCLEIGTFMGRSASVICQALEHIGAEHALYCVDFYVQKYNQSYLNTKSKIYMINRCGPEVAKLYTDFDNLKNLEDCFHLTVSRKPLMQKYVKLIKSNSAELDISKIPLLDFAYIDGDHTYDGVRIDTLNVLSRLNPDGMIVYNNYLERFDGVMRLIDELRDLPGIHFEGQEQGNIAFTVSNPKGALIALDQSKSAKRIEMFHIITKNEYFEALDDEKTRAKIDSLKYAVIDLKHIQDAWVLYNLRDAKGLKILEIGGGYSRALRTIANDNEMWNLDDFGDRGTSRHGRKIPKFENIKHVLDNLGNFSRELPDGYFDVIVSISVVEHILHNEFPNFWGDHARLMKDNGIALHAIDFYIEDKKNNHVEKRIDVLQQSLFTAGLTLVTDPEFERPLVFRSNFASNPDLGMWYWSSMSKDLSLNKNRTRMQSVSLGVCISKHLSRTFE